MPKKAVHPYTVEFWDHKIVIESKNIRHCEIVCLPGGLDFCTIAVHNGCFPDFPPDIRPYARIISVTSELIWNGWVVYQEPNTGLMVASGIGSQQQLLETEGAAA